MSRRSSRVVSVDSKRHRDSVISTLLRQELERRQSRDIASFAPPMFELPGIQISRIETVDYEDDPGGSGSGRGGLKRYIIFHSDLSSDFSQLSFTSEDFLPGSRSSRSRSSRASSNISSRLWDFSPRESEWDGDVSQGSRESQLSRQDWCGGPSRGMNRELSLLSPTMPRKGSVVTFDMGEPTRRHSSPAPSLDRRKSYSTADGAKLDFPPSSLRYKDAPSGAGSRHVEEYRVLNQYRKRSAGDQSIISIRIDEDDGDENVDENDDDELTPLNSDQPADVTASDQNADATSSSERTSVSAKCVEVVTEENEEDYDVDGCGGASMAAATEEFSEIMMLAMRHASHTSCPTHIDNCNINSKSVSRISDELSSEADKSNAVSESINTNVRGLKFGSASKHLMQKKHERKPPPSEIVSSNELQVSPYPHRRQPRESIRSLGQFLKGTLSRSKTLVQQGALSRALDEKTLARPEAADTSVQTTSSLKTNIRELSPVNLPSSSGSALCNDDSNQPETNGESERTECSVERKRYKWLSYLQPSTWRSTPAPDNGRIDISSFDNTQRNSLHN